MFNKGQATTNLGEFSEREPSDLTQEIIEDMPRGPGGDPRQEDGISNAITLNEIPGSDEEAMGILFALDQLAREKEEQ